MKKIFYRWGIVSALGFAPVLAFAAGEKNLKWLINEIISYFSMFMVLIIGLAVLTFVWNVYNYFFKADVENKKEAGLYVLYSTIGFFVILSLWGLVNIISNTFSLDNTAPSWWPFNSSYQRTGGNNDIFNGNTNSNGLHPDYDMESGTYDDTTNSNGLQGTTNSNGTRSSFFDSSSRNGTDIPSDSADGPRGDDPSAFHGTDIPASGSGGQTTTQSNTTQSPNQSAPRFDVVR